MARVAGPNQQRGARGAQLGREGAERRAQPGLARRVASGHQASILDKQRNDRSAALHGVVERGVVGEAQIAAKPDDDDGRGHG